VEINQSFLPRYVNEQNNLSVIYIYIYIFSLIDMISND
jgi:hypothetical protein